MGRRRMYNTVRTDTFEAKIAFAAALGRYEAEQALRDLAKDVGAPISEEAITKHAAQVQAKAKEWGWVK